MMLLKIYPEFSTKEVSFMESNNIFVSTLVKYVDFNAIVIEFCFIINVNLLQSCKYLLNFVPCLKTY